MFSVIIPLVFDGRAGMTVCWNEILLEWDWNLLTSNRTFILDFLWHFLEGGVWVGALNNARCQPFWWRKGSLQIARNQSIELNNLFSSKNRNIPSFSFSLINGILKMTYCSVNTLEIVGIMDFKTFNSVQNK